MSLYHDHGIVLRTYKLGEADRIVVVLTRDHGKVRAVAKGVRRTTSRFGGRLEPTSHVSLLLHHGRGELDTISQAETVDHFRAIRDDFDRLGRAASLLEVVDQFAQERQPDVRLYQMLLGGLRTLAQGNAAVLVGAFYWKLLAAEGLRPELERCVACGEADGLVWFGLDDGGVLCTSCRAGAHGAVVAVSPPALAVLRGVLGGSLNEALGLAASPATHEVEALATRAMEHHLERRLRAVHVLEH